MSIRPDQIPPEVVEAAANEMGDLLSGTPHHNEYWRRQARAAIAAALSAWPGMHKWDTAQVWHQAAIVLPLPQESKE